MCDFGSIFMNLVTINDLIISYDEKVEKYDDILCANSAIFAGPVTNVHSIQHYLLCLVAPTRTFYNS